MFLCAAAIFAAASAGCGKAEQQPDTGTGKIMSVRFFTLHRNSAERYRMFPGIIQPEDQVNLSFRVGGQLILFNAGAGKVFKKGALLAKLDPECFQAEVDSAEAKYSEALKDYQRCKALYSKNVVAAAEFEKKQRDLDMSKAALRNAKEDLRNTEIFAPFDGISSTTSADTYQQIKANEPVIRYQNLNALQVGIDVPEKDFYTGVSNSIGEVNKIADECGGFYGTIPALPGKKFKLALKETATEADSVTQTFRVTFRILPQKLMRLFPGMTMAVHVPDLKYSLEGKQKPSMFDVPFRALFSKNGKSYVWLIGKDSKVRAIEVKTASVYGSAIGISSDLLHAGDTIAASGAAVLYEGAEVRRLREFGNRKSGGQ